MIKRWSVAPSTIYRYIVELMIRVKDDTHLVTIDNVTLDWLRQTTTDLSQDWKNFNGTILSSIAGAVSADEASLKLFINCDLKLIEEACLIDLEYDFMPTTAQIKACKM